MTDPVLHLVAGPNGAGKSTLYDRRIRPTTHLEFVNADEIAKTLEGDPLETAYEASAKAAAQRESLIRARRSFATETVFSHPSKLELIKTAQAAGYVVTLYVVVIPEELSVQRVSERVSRGGHDVPEEKTRTRYRRLWPLVADAVAIVEETLVYDNTRADAALALVARFRNGRLVSTVGWPTWMPHELQSVGI
jgi:predicted ABC-type ATPase